MSYEPILLAPEEELEEIYPFRRVWRTSALEVSVLLAAVLAIAILTGLLGLLPDTWTTPLPRVGIALLPLAAWLFFSYRGERRALQPRHRLIGVLILGALVANGVAIPLESRVYMLDRWLPGQGFFGRVLGYMTTAGFTCEFLKYLVLRYTIWPGRIRQRLDGVAYALAASLGYALVYNLHAALYTDATLSATALRVASLTLSQLAIGVVMGFFLAEMAIGRVPVFWMSMGLGLASLLDGLYYAFRSLAIVSGLSVTGTANAPIRGLALAAGLVVVMFAVFAFLIDSADRRMEAVIGRRQAL